MGGEPMPGQGRLVEESSAQCVFVPRVGLGIEYQVHRSQWCDTAAYIRRLSCVRLSGDLQNGLAFFFVYTCIHCL